MALQRVRLESINTPAQKVLLSDSPIRDSFPPDTICNYCCGPLMPWFIPIHGQAMNVAYADGHTEPMKLPMPGSYNYGGVAWRVAGVGLSDTNAFWW
jgi:prepilin-type processing-associated H-X9-DG protein